MKRLLCLAVLLAAGCEYQPTQTAPQPVDIPPPTHTMKVVGAWHYKRFSDDKYLSDSEWLAKENGIGLWSDPRYVAPWDWRKLPKEERDKLR